MWAAVRYLVEAGGRHPSLVKKHSRCTCTVWCLVCSKLCTTCLADAKLMMIKLPGCPHVHMATPLCRWILKADPEAGLEMFTEMNPPLAPATVLPILTAQAPLLCAPYLESAIHAGTATAEVGVQKPALSSHESVQSNQGFGLPCGIACWVNFSLSCLMRLTAMPC